MALKLDVLAAVTSKDKIDNGAWLHYRSPIVAPGDDQGPLLYRRNADGTDDVSKPVRALVRSQYSGYYRSRNLALQTVTQSRVGRSKQDQRDEVIRKAVEMERPHQFSYLLAAFENVSSEVDGLQKPEEAELLALAQEGEYQWLVNQTMNFAFTDSNYGSGEEVAEATKGNGSAGAAKAAAAESAQSES
jgi:hypothetical protein